MTKETLPRSTGARDGARIRRATPDELGELFDIWLRSVRTTHTFVPETELQTLSPLVRDYLASSDSELWVLCDATGVIMGFMGMAGPRIEALFLAPDYHGRGAGRRMVGHARALRGEIAVEVNEQNIAAVGFYKACGFVVEGRSEVDDGGRPYPLLHMRLAAAAGIID